jgi:hypothetical protein
MATERSLLIPSSRACILSVIAFHEKAGLSQEIFLCRVATVCWRQPTLPNLKGSTWRSGDRGVIGLRILFR